VAVQPDPGVLGTSGEAGAGRSRPASKALCRKGCFQANKAVRNLIGVPAKVDNGIAMSEPVQLHTSDMWPEERPGYDAPVPVAYAALPVVPSPRPGIPLWVEEKVAACIAVAGVLWSAQAVTTPISRVANLTATPGPLELCGISILVWLHIKWRRSMGR
jgi:hypothetical protein